MVEAAEQYKVRLAAYVEGEVAHLASEPTATILAGSPYGAAA